MRRAVFAAEECYTQYVTPTSSASLYQSIHKVSVLQVLAKVLSFARPRFGMSRDLWYDGAKQSIHLHDGGEMSTYLF
jgi:hypothetical protein